MELSRDEEAALAGEHGEIMEMAYRILVATGEAADAKRLVPVQWAHLSGVNYNTIGDAGEKFLRGISSKGAKVKIKTTLNPMGFDVDYTHDLDDEFVSKQLSIGDSYRSMGVTPSYSCIPYEIYEMPKKGAQVAFAESNAAVHANSLDGVRTNKESAFSALASALTGKSPYSRLRMHDGDDDEKGKKNDDDDDDDDDDDITIRVRTRSKPKNELEYGLLGYFAGKVGDTSVNISGTTAPSAMDRRECKAICGGMGTSGTCAKFRFVEDSTNGEQVDYGDEEMNQVRDELDTAENGDMVVLGSPQLGLQEIADLRLRLKGRSFKKRCLVFCPRTVKESAVENVLALERAGCEVLADCCTCLSPLITADRADSVITNSVKGAFYLNAGGVYTDLRPLSDILESETC